MQGTRLWIKLLNCFFFFPQLQLRGKLLFCSMSEKRIHPLDSALPLSTFEKEEQPENPEDRLIENLDAGKFLDFLKDHLNPNQFLVLVGYIVEGKNFSELAREMELSPTRVQQIYNKAVEVAKHAFSIRREYEEVPKKPKEITYLDINDGAYTDVDKKNKIEREKLDKLADLLLEGILRDKDE